eukprot:m.22668 g.22668  ORF g.22668 m.22668 type:complete len:88 (-) comp8879_c0_seq2:784-1047(-)
MGLQLTPSRQTLYVTSFDIQYRCSEPSKCSEDADLEPRCTSVGTILQYFQACESFHGPSLQGSRVVQPFPVLNFGLVLKQFRHLEPY